MEKFKEKIEPILKEHLALDRECAKDYYYDFDSRERGIIWNKEKEALNNVKFEDVIAYLDSVNSAEKLSALSEEFYDDISCNLYGDKKNEVLECFKRNNKRLNANLDDFLKATENNLK